MVRPQRSTLLAAGGFLLLSLVVYRAVLPDPVALAPYPARVFDNLPNESGGLWLRLSFADRAMVMATIAGNASRLVSPPFSPYGDAHCYPTPDAMTLGEPMLTVSWMAAPVQALFGEPILTYNVLLIVRLWLAGMAMFLLARALALGAPAAAVAGAGFMLHSPRLLDTDHPYVFGDLWLPLILLFTIRLMAGGGIRAFLLLVGAATLLVGESIYPMIGSALLLSAYAPFLFWRYRARARHWLPLLVAAVSIVGAIALILFQPWLASRALWETLDERMSLVFGLGSLLPGGHLFPGPIVSLLAVVGLLSPALFGREASRPPVSPPDLRAGCLLAALVIAWSTVWFVTIPGTELRLPSLIRLLRSFVPGADAVRGLGALANHFGFPLALLAGYGANAIFTRLGRHTSAWLSLGLVLAMLGVRSYGPVTRPLFRDLLRIDADGMRPAEEDLQLHRTHVRGPTVEVPTFLEDGKLTQLTPARYLLLGAWNPHPVNTCYNSFSTPVQSQIAAYAKELPDHDAAQALAALGFETLLVHEPSRTNVQSFRNPAAIRAAGLVKLDETPGITAFRLPGPPLTAQQSEVLAASTAELLPIDARNGRLRLPIHNSSERTWRHPEPFLMRNLVAEWQQADGPLSYRSEFRALLPLALAPGASSVMTWNVPVPEQAGPWQLRITDGHGLALGPFEVTKAPVANAEPAA